jgi:hypothetical protein
MLSTKFQFIWESGFRGEDFLKSTNQKQELPVVAMFGMLICPDSITNMAATGNSCF